MFEIVKKEPIIVEKPIKHLQESLEYETKQFHLWLLSHKASTVGYLVYFRHNENIIVHIKPPLIDFGPELRQLSSTEKMMNEAMFISRDFRNMGGMKILITELINEARDSDAREIRIIDIADDRLVKKLSEQLKESIYGQIYTVEPKEHEGGISLIAVKNDQKNKRLNLETVPKILC